MRNNVLSKNQNMKKPSLVFAIIIMLIMLTSCRFDYSKYPYYIEDTDSITY
jgi:hypothetical protein